MKYLIVYEQVPEHTYLISYESNEPDVLLESLANKISGVDYLTEEQEFLIGKLYALRDIQLDKTKPIPLKDYDFLILTGYMM